MVAQGNQAQKPGKVWYVSKSPNLVLANFVPDKYEHGRLVPGRDMCFLNHILVTEDKNVQEFIESSQRFRNGEIRRCADGKEATAVATGFGMEHRGKRRSKSGIEGELEVSL
jgi:hypothetical protein